MTRCFVIMGVAGCGKSTVGNAVAATTDIAYVDGDDLHPEANIKKMSAGTPLDDDDRAPWLAQVGAKLGTSDGRIAIGCSALKQKYRTLITKSAGEPVAFIHLAAPQKVIAERMAQRDGHFMPTSLLDSQFADLEHLGAGELGTTVDITGPFDTVVTDVCAYVGSGGSALPPRLSPIGLGC